MQEELQIIDMRRDGKYYGRVTSTDAESVMYICFALQTHGFETWTTTAVRKSDGKFYWVETHKEFIL